MTAFITKPCENCGVPVQDKPDPTYTGKWTCYYCHCLLTGRDPKKVLNDLTQLMKLELLVQVPDFDARLAAIRKPPERPS